MLEKNKNRIYFISILRALAICFVVWDHLGPFWSQSVGIQWYPATIIQRYINKPLVIIQDFGFFGVSLFFLVSGFIITYVAQRENKIEFVFKRIFRIFPPLIISVAIFGMTNIIIEFIAKSPTYWSQFSIKQWIMDGTLLNYFLNNTSVINGVTWSLIIEVLFYLICFILLDFIKNSPKIALIFMVLINISITFLAYRSTYFHILLISASYLPILALGQVLYYIYSKKINLIEYVIFTTIFYFVFILNIMKIYPQYYEENNSYGVSFIYSYLIFIIFMLLNDNINNIFNKGKGRIFIFISDISYSLYLLHMTFGTLILTFMYKRFNYSLTFIITIIIIFLLSYLHYIFIEKPFMLLSKKLLNTSDKLLPQKIGIKVNNTAKIVMFILFIILSIIVAFVKME